MKVAHAIGGFTLVLAVFGCREVSTDLQRRNPTDPSPTFDVAANRTTVFHFVANGETSRGLRTRCLASPACPPGTLSVSRTPYSSSTHVVLLQAALARFP